MVLGTAPTPYVPLLPSHFIKVVLEEDGGGGDDDEHGGAGVGGGVVGSRVIG